MSDPTLLRQVYYPQDDERRQRDKLGRLTHLLSNPAHPIEVTVRRHRKKHSSEARGYLWGVCYAMLSEASGYEKEELHEAMCARYFGTKVVEVMGQRFERPSRTTTTNEAGERDELSAKDYYDFIEAVIREAALWYDVIIPPPQGRVA